MVPKFDKYLGMAVKFRRLSQSIRQAEFVSMVGLSQPVMSRLENGTAVIGVWRLMTFAELLDTEPSKLILYAQELQIENEKYLDAIAPKKDIFL